MGKGEQTRRGSIFGAVLLIALGGLFLAGNLLPSFNPWPWVARYWPGLILLWGLYKLTEYFRFRDDPEAAAAARIGGGEIALLVFLVIFGSLFSSAYRQVGSWHESGRERVRRTENIARGRAEAVDAHLHFPAGELFIGAGAADLLEANFTYDKGGPEPEVEYSESDSRGRLDLRQRGKNTVHLGVSGSRWELFLNEEVPLTLEIEMGAGQATLELGSLRVTRLEFKMGAGQTELDLRGDWKEDFEADISGGVGHAIVRLPRNVGVRVKASGALGSIDVEGLEKRGSYYVNELYGESAVTLDLEISGAIGTIEIIG